MVQCGTPQGKRPLGRPRLKWEKIKKDIQMLIDIFYRFMNKSVMNYVWLYDINDQI